MSLLQKISNKLIILLITVLLIFAPRVVFQSQSIAPKTTSTATAQAKLSFDLEIPQKALFKNTVTVSARVAPGTSCELTYISPAGDMSIMNTTADEDGKCIWRWKIDETQGKGNGRLIFTIESVSETHFIEIRSSF